MEIDFRELRSLSPIKLYLLLRLVEKSKKGEKEGISLAEFSDIVGLESNQLAPLLRFPARTQKPPILSRKETKRYKVGKRVEQQKEKEETVYYLEPNFLNKVLNSPSFYPLLLNIIDKEHTDLNLPNIQLSIEQLDRKELKVVPAPMEVLHFLQIGCNRPMQFMYSDGRGVSCIITKYSIAASLLEDECALSFLGCNWQLSVLEQRCFLPALSHPQYTFILNPAFGKYDSQCDDAFELALADEPKLRHVDLNKSLKEIYGIECHYLRKGPDEFRFREMYLDEEGEKIISDIVGFEPLRSNSGYWMGMKCKGKLPLCRIRENHFGFCIKPFHQGLSSTVASIRYDSNVMEIKTPPDIIQRETIGAYPNIPEGLPIITKPNGFQNCRRSTEGISWEVRPYRESADQKWHDWFIDSRLHIQLLRWQLELKEEPPSIVVLRKDAKKICGGYSCPDSRFAKQV